jgi:ABC-2 family transporter protein
VIRLTLRQFRAEAIIAFGALTALAIALLITGVHLAHVNDAFQTACQAAGDCDSVNNPIGTLYRPLQTALPLLVILTPALLGLFLGAPLIARELETGTFRLVWTQSITRARWLTAKLGLVGLAAMTIAGLLTWIVNWWASPLDAINQDRFDPESFGYHGIVTIGYTAFAIALGAAAGLLLRRTVPAMALTLAGYAAARLAVTYWIRPHLATPLHTTLTFAQAQPRFGISISPGVTDLRIMPGDVNIPGAWIYSAAIADNADNKPNAQVLAQVCPGLAKGPQSGQILRPQDFQACTDKLAATYHTLITYQPANRFWQFQWAELGIFLAAALALCALCYWRIHRRYAS